MKARLTVAAVSTIVVLVALLAPGSASAASPVLEFVSPGSSLPISFTEEGGPVLAELAGFEMVVRCAGSSAEGEITGPRSTTSSYRFTGCVAMRGATVEAKCKSEDAGEEEIRTGSIVAELVYLDQAKREVGILLNPGGGVYMSFECGGEHTEARGPFLSTIAPIDEASSTFTATLSQSGGVQTPDEYENAAGERLKAVAEGKRDSGEWVTTGVATAITVHPSAPVEISAITAAEVEAKQREANTRQHEAEASAAAAAKRQQEEAAARKHHEEEVAAATKRQAEDRAEKRREEEAAAALQPAIRGALATAAKIGALLKHGGLTLTFSSSESGTLVIEWWRLPSRAHLAKNRALRPTLVAQGIKVFSSAGVGTVNVRLTRSGRRLLGRARKVKLASRVRFTPNGRPTISASGVLTLRR